MLALLVPGMGMGGGETTLPPPSPPPLVHDDVAISYSQTDVPAIKYTHADQTDFVEGQT